MVEKRGPLGGRAVLVHLDVDTDERVRVIARQYGQRRLSAVVRVASRRLLVAPESVPVEAIWRAHRVTVAVRLAADVAEVLAVVGTESGLSLAEIVGAAVGRGAVSVSISELTSMVAADEGVPRSSSVAVVLDGYLSRWLAALEWPRPVVMAALARWLVTSTVDLSGLHGVPRQAPALKVPFDPVLLADLDVVAAGVGVGRNAVVTAAVQGLCDDPGAEVGQDVHREAQWGLWTRREYRVPR